MLGEHNCQIIPMRGQVTMLAPHSHLWKFVFVAADMLVIALLPIILLCFVKKLYYKDLTLSLLEILGWTFFTNPLS